MQSKNAQLGSVLTEDENRTKGKLAIDFGFHATF